MKDIFPKKLYALINNNHLLDAAFNCAKDEHNKTGALRSGTCLPYIVHPVAVALILAEWGAPDEVVASGFLHDVPEDTDFTLQEIEELFGLLIKIILDGVTNVATKADGNRARRFAINAHHSSNADWRSKWVKMADIFHNTSDLHKQKSDKRFYLIEKWIHLHAIWDERLVEYFEQVKEQIMRIAKIMDVQLPELSTPHLITIPSK